MADLDSRDKEELRRLRRKLDGVRGEGVIHTRETLSIGQASRAVDKRVPAPPAVFRMRVTASDAGPAVALAKFYNGTDTTGDEIPVRVWFMPVADTEIYAFVPVGGTDSVYGGQPVIWLQMFELGDPQYQGMVLQAVADGAYAWDFVRAVALPEEV